VLFHPNSGNGKDGEIGAVRVGSYKVVYYSGKYNTSKKKELLTLKVLV
jgi:hypothetical protein